MILSERKWSQRTSITLAPSASNQIPHIQSKFENRQIDNRPILSYVFCFFFLAAGKRILFKISLYPGELGYRSRSVGGSPT